MEISNYKVPTSWNDKGMNWNNPDLSSVDYIMALKEAIIERYEIYGIYYRSTTSHFVDPLYKITPSSPFNLNQVLDIIYSLEGLNDVFVEEIANKPKKISIYKLWQEENLGTFDTQNYRGATIEKLVPWFKAIRNIINKLTLIAPAFLFVRYRSVSGSTQRLFNEPVWDEELKRKVYLYPDSTQGALDNAISNIHGRDNEKHYYSISAISGSCSIDELANSYTGSGHGVIKNKGYDANVYCQEFSSDGKARIHSSASCNIILKYTPIYYTNSDWKNSSSHLPANIFCPNGKIPVFTIGDINDIPYNGAVPANGETVISGYEYLVQTFADFGISGGFKFQ